MRKGALLAAAAVVAAITGGIAFGAIGDGGVIQGCYDSGGNVKVVATLPCPKGHKPFSWNAQGPKGDTGAPGVDGIDGQDGEDGEDGARGPSDAFTTFAGYEPDGLRIGLGGNAFVASLELPAGSFLLSGSVLVDDSDPTDWGAVGTCGFESVDWPGAIGTYDFPGQHRGIVVISGVVTLADAATLQIRCRNDGTDDVVVRWARATAVQVGALHVQP